MELEEMDGFKRTGVIWAAEMGNVHMLSSLIEFGADVDAADDENQTALIRAWWWWWWWWWCNWGH